MSEALQTWFPKYRFPKYRFPKTPAPVNPRSYPRRHLPEWASYPMTLDVAAVRTIMQRNATSGSLRRQTAYRMVRQRFNAEVSKGMREIHSDTLYEWLCEAADHTQWE